ncbi:MAG: AAA family ATPase [Desulfobacteraceae bacterium]
MYEEFFGLKEKPFDLAPSSRYLYLSEGHKEALALLTYGVMERRGFVLLTGDVGTGKTTVVQALLSNLGTDVKYVHITNPLLTPREFIDYLSFSAFGSKAHFKSKVNFLFDFEAFLRDCFERRITFIMIVDEAQALSFGLLEEIRLLSNMEYADSKLVNIFLVGQPELNERLKDPRCKPLRQRIASRYHLPSLDLHGTENYISTRLRVAGVEETRSIFPPKSIQAIHEATRGIPRIINILADNALLLGYSKGRRKISPEMIRECHSEMDQEFEPDPGEESATVHEPSPEPQPAPSRKSGFRRVFLLVLLLAAAAAAALTRPESRELLISLIPGHATRNAKVVEKIPLQEPLVAGTGGDRERTEVEPGEPPAPVLEPEAGEEEKSALRIPEPEELPGPEKSAPEDLPEERVVVVKQGDSLARLAAEVYGRADEEILDLIQRRNPEIEDINSIRVGQKILFPSLDESVKSVAGAYTVHVASYKPFKAAHDAFQRLIARGHEAYIIPAANDNGGIIYRVTTGSFAARGEASKYARELLAGEEFEYAQVLHFEVK